MAALEQVADGPAVPEGPVAMADGLRPTNICRGGEDRRTAWITQSGSGRLARLRWPVPGLELAHTA